MYDDAGVSVALAAEYDAKREALIRQIEVAFADASLPPKGDVFRETDPDSYERLPSDFEAKFPRTHWRHVPVNIVLYLYTPAGYRFVLPAYMIDALLDTEKLTDLELLFSFTGGTFYQQDLLEGLDKSQLEVVLEFIRFYDLMWDDWDKNNYKDELAEAMKAVSALL